MKKVKPKRLFASPEWADYHIIGPFEMTIWYGKSGQKNNALYFYHRESLDPELFHKMLEEYLNEED